MAHNDRLRTVDAMEAEERPRKLRKLSDQLEDHIVRLQPRDSNTAESENVDGESSETGSDDVDDGEEVLIQTNAPVKDEFEGSDHEGQELGNAAQQPLSKNQQKKAKKKADWEAGREDRKLKRREKAKEKRERRRITRDGKVQAEKNAALVDVQHGRVSRPPPNRRHYLLPISFVIDCGFDSLMHEREVISLGSQVTRAYSDNSKALYQAHLYVSGWKRETELRKRFDGLLKGVHNNWRGFKFIEDDFVDAATQARTAMCSKHSGRMLGAFEKYAPAKKQVNGHTAEAPGDDSTEDVPVLIGDADDSRRAEREASADRHEALAAAATVASAKVPTPTLQELQDQNEVIYLTSDSPYTLAELKPYHTYIIGGLVDKNRYKGICYKTALDANGTASTKELLNGKEVKTAKLPIGDYMSMLGRQVLATNHVVEIMLRWLECGDWGQAFVKVMPKRKGAKLKEDAYDKEYDRKVDAEEEADAADYVSDDSITKDLNDADRPSGDHQQP